MSRIHHEHIQPYPRIDGYLLNDQALVKHSNKLSREELYAIIKEAIIYANRKSSRAILDITENMSDDEVSNIYNKSGSYLYTYFLRYCEDPTTTAYQCLGRHVSEVAREQFHNRTLQKDCMNSEWRYQLIAKNAASRMKRFRSVSDLGISEADFNAVIQYDSIPEQLSIYVSVKNCANTMGNHDWQQAICALESVAQSEKKSNDCFLCVFGITMEQGYRNIHHDSRTNMPYSYNTEVWRSDFFWPFFTNESYEYIMKYVLEVLMELRQPTELMTDIPEELVDSFGYCCRHANIIDKNGIFNDAHLLVKFFCR